MYLISFLVSLYFSFIAFLKREYKPVVVIILILLLSLFAGTRTGKIDADFETYVRAFTNAAKWGPNKDILVTMEPSFFFIPKFSYFLSADYFLELSFLIFAIFGVSTKIIAIKNADFFLLSVALYISNLFFMQEMTTIRAGVASGFFLWSIQDIVNKKDRNFLMKMLFALMFHYSSLLFIVIWIILKLRLKIKLYYIILFISFAIAIFRVNILQVLYLDVIFPKVQIYLYYMNTDKTGDAVNIFNFRILFAFFIFILCSVKYRLLEDNPLFNVLFKIHIISLSIFFALSPTVKVFSLRSFELLSVVQILLYPMIIYFFKEKIIPFGIIFAFCILQYFYMINISNVLKDYQSWLF